MKCVCIYDGSCFFFWLHSPAYNPSFPSYLQIFFPFNPSFLFFYLLPISPSLFPLSFGKSLFLFHNMNYIVIIHILHIISYCNYILQIISYFRSLFILSVFYTREMMQFFHVFVSFISHKIIVWVCTYLRRSLSFIFYDWIVIHGMKKKNTFFLSIHHLMGTCVVSKIFFQNRTI